jgi:hypothetical protein
VPGRVAGPERGRRLDRAPPEADDPGFPVAVGVISMKDRIGRLRDDGVAALAGVVLLAGAGLGLLLAVH